MAISHSDFVAWTCHSRSISVVTAKKGTKSRFETEMPRGSGSLGTKKRTRINLALEAVESSRSSTTPSYSCPVSVRDHSDAPRPTLQALTRKRATPWRKSPNVGQIDPLQDLGQVACPAGIPIVISGEPAAFHALLLTFVNSRWTTGASANGDKIRTIRYNVRYSRNLGLTFGRPAPRRRTAQCERCPCALHVLWKPSRVAMPKLDQLCFSRQENAACLAKKLGSAQHSDARRASTIGDKDRSFTAYSKIVLCLVQFHVEAVQAAALRLGTDLLEKVLGTLFYSAHWSLEAVDRDDFLPVFDRLQIYRWREGWCDSPWAATMPFLASSPIRRYTPGYRSAGTASANGSGSSSTAEPTCCRLAEAAEPAPIPCCGITSVHLPI
ncbi:uncharacterized protein PSANT_06972 [Moesziomyces antarcticus]|uniref:Uncharacterized protein n=1 Tax=Pseudozyma antarctica TaxID=84753 RepID=A0A5C3FZQ6_PSEA2|nr:uncharacterized protein PSANT_06972 [Moesziomyces antarcticus]